MNLPKDIYFDISKFLPVGDLISLIKTCKKVKNNLLDEQIWKYLTLRDYPDISLMKILDPWMIVYKKRYYMEKFNLRKCNVRECQEDSVKGDIFLHNQDYYVNNNDDEYNIIGGVKSCRNLPIFDEFPINYWNLDNFNRHPKYIWFDAEKYLDEIISNTVIDLDNELIRSTFIIDYCEFLIWIKNCVGIGYIVGYNENRRKKTLRKLYLSRMYSSMCWCNQCDDDYIKKYPNKILYLDPNRCKYDEKENIKFLTEAEKNGDMEAYLHRLQRIIPYGESGYWNDVFEKSSREVITLWIKHNEYALDAGNLICIPLDYDDLFYLGLERKDVYIGDFINHDLFTEENLKDDRMIRRIKTLICDPRFDKEVGG